MLPSSLEKNTLAKYHFFRIQILLLGQNVHCNIQINLWNLQVFSGATKLPFFHFRCICVNVFCMTNCSCKWGSDIHLQNVIALSKVNGIFWCHQVTIFQFRCVFVYFAWQNVVWSVPKLRWFLWGETRIVPPSQQKMRSEDSEVSRRKDC